MPLLRRAGRTVSPTEAGHRLAERARVLLAELTTMHSGRRRRRGRAGADRRRDNTMLNGPLPMVLDALVQEHPAARIVVRTGLTSELYDGCCAAGSTRRSACIRPSCCRRRCNWVLLREERLVVLRPSAWAQRDPHELLRDEPLIRYDRRLGGGQAADRYLRRAGIVPRERFEISSLAAIAMLVAAAWACRSRRMPRPPGGPRCRWRGCRCRSRPRRGASASSGRARHRGRAPSRCWWITRGA